MASNPEKQQLLYDEIVKQTTLGKPITAEMFEQMPYMKACVKESFRLAKAIVICSKRVYDLPTSM